MKKVFLILIALIGIGICLMSCNKEPDGSEGNPGDNPGSNYGTTIEDFPASFAKKLFENWDCSRWLKSYYSAQGFVGIETMHNIATADCETEIDIIGMSESLYEHGNVLLSSSSYNQNTKCVTIYFARYSGGSWDYYALIFYTIDVIK